VLWAAAAAAVGLSVLVAVIASAQPSSEVTARSLLLGRPAPVIAGPGIGAGRHYSLAQFRGKWVLVNFMATWCTACQQEMPQLAAFAREHSRDADATVLTVAYDPSDVSHLRGFLAARGARWPAVNDPAASVSYGVTGLPSSFLVGPSGYVYAYVPGEVRASQVNGWIKQAEARGFGSG
jgi:thiol-disulfide isomerase/thioredoxin